MYKVNAVKFRSGVMELSERREAPGEESFFAKELVPPANQAITH